MPLKLQHKVMKLRSTLTDRVRNSTTERDQPCIEDLFDAEESPLLRYAYGMVGRREVAEEMVQDAFLKLHTHWSAIETPRAWLYRATRNLCLNYLRKHQRESLSEEADTNPGLKDQPDEQMGRMEAIGTLKILIEELPPADRHLIELKYHEELTYGKIGEFLNLNAGTVGYKLHHVLKHLAQALQKSGITSSRG